MTKKDEKLAAILKALADPTRREILEAAGTGALCVSAVAGRLGVTQSAVSQHLRILRSAGLVTAEKRGYFVHYHINRAQLQEFSAQINNWNKTLLGLTEKACPKAKSCHKRSGRTGKTKGAPKS